MGREGKAKINQVVSLKHGAKISKIAKKLLPKVKIQSRELVKRARELVERKVMRRFLELIEQKENVVFTFGRFNPPTTGHEKLIQKVASVAGNSPFRIYPSYSQNQKKDPLPFH